jgi:activating signal cointegrator 1
MRALSWKNPYGVLMLYNKIETRKWDTKYRGQVLICTSKKPYRGSEVSDLSEVWGYMYISVFLKDERLLHYNGYAIGVGDLVHCRPMIPEDCKLAFVKYREDLFSHFYENVREIQPIPWKGSQGWKTVDQDFIDKIVYV